MTIGTHLVTVAGTDVTCLADQVTINHGRADTTSQPAASTASIDVTLDAAHPLPAVIDVGARVVVSTAVPGGHSWQRFTGRITDVNLGWDDNGTDTPTSGVAQVVAVSDLADLGRRNVGAEPFPQEFDGGRVARVAALAGVALNAFTSDPGTVQVLPRDIDTQPALAVMQGTAESGGGVVWQMVSGEIRYTDANHRRNVAVSLTLDACDLLVTPTWVRNLDGLTNEVSIGYGIAAGGGGGGQPQYVAENPTSKAKWGRYAYSTATELAALADAQFRGDLALTRNAQPAWVLSAIPVDVAGLTTGSTDKLLALDVSDLVQLTNLPPIGAAPTGFPAWVEGWTETLTYGGHDLQLVLSDYCRTSVPVTWDTPVGVTWNTIPGAATRTWDQSTCIGPTPSVGRWDDTPGAVRWDLVPATVTWDNWTGVFP